MLLLLLKGYVSVRKDREDGKGGGCVPFIKEGMPYRVVEKGVIMEYIVVEIWSGMKNCQTCIIRVKDWHKTIWKK